VVDQLLRHILDRGVGDADRSRARLRRLRHTIKRRGDVRPIESSPLPV
jgi:hypothetical protein